MKNFIKQVFTLVCFIKTELVPSVLSFKTYSKYILQEVIKGRGEAVKEVHSPLPWVGIRSLSTLQKAGSHIRSSCLTWDCVEGRSQNISATEALLKIKGWVDV